MPSVNRFTRGVLSFLPLLLPVFFYLGVLLFWQSHDLYGITGDEPHYLLVTDSLYRDRDLFVENNYLMETPVSRACKVNLREPVDMRRHLLNGYSMHNIGLPLLLLLPYSIAGVTGAKIFMALAAGLWPFLLYKAALQITGSRPWSILLAVTLALGLPYLAAANQIYIDLAGGMIILYVAENIIGILRGHYKQLTTANSIALGLAIAFLPWLHIRLSAPAIILLLAYVYAVAFSARASEATRAKRRLLVPVAIVAGSIITLACYNRIAFGNAVTGPYYGYLSFDVRKIALTFTGLHWDMAQGLFMQQPLLILGLFGIVPLVKDNKASAILLALVSLSVLVPNSMLHLWYGSASFYGRYYWPVVSLWVFPLAYAVRMLFEYRKTFILPLCLACLVWQGWMVSRWLTDNGLLINVGWPAWAARNFYANNSWLLLRLPFFKNVNDYENLYDCLRQPANYVCLLLSALLIITGWLWRSGAWRWLAKVWAAFLIASACAIVFIPPSLPYWSVTADVLPSEVGALDDKSLIARDGESRKGFLIYGPYVMLVAGEYEITVEYESAGLPGASAPRFDIAYDFGNRIIAEADLPPSGESRGTFKYRLPVDEKMSMNKPFEFRVWYPGSGTLMIKRLTVTRLHP